jgi:predicted O-linked N-acetylglucosamine transferase (SPINDLY family)
MMDQVDYIPTYKRVFDYLAALSAGQVILWFFFQVPIYQNFNIRGYRLVYEAMLDYALEKWPVEINFDSRRLRDAKMPVYEQVSRGSTYYYNLVYHGLSDRILISKWNALLRKIYPQLVYTARPLSSQAHSSPYSNPKYLIEKDNKLNYLLDIYESEKGLATGVESEKGLATTTSQPRKLVYPAAEQLGSSSIAKIRICIISNKLVHYTSVFRDRIGIINNLDRRYFDVWLGLYTPMEQVMANNLNPIVWHFLEHFYRSKHVVQLAPGDLAGNQRTIEAGKFHIILYADLGMLQDQTLLAHARLAPIQMVTWGHSDTSGNLEIDYYITSRYFENTQDLSIPKSNYSETPILLKTSGTYYYSPLKMVERFMTPNARAKFQTAEQLGFPPGALIIGCLQSFFKFNNDFEQVLASILRRTAAGIGTVGCKRGRPVYLALSNSIPFNKVHLDKLNLLFKDHIDRIMWFQNKAPDEWLNLVSICHVMLDPFPFGGCNTSLEAFDFGIPVICKPSNVINGRFTRGFYEIMGMDLNLCCATNSDEYVDKVLRLLNDDFYYTGVSQSILKGKARLFENPETVADYQNMLVKLIRRHTASATPEK